MGLSKNNTDDVLIQQAIPLLSAEAEGLIVLKEDLMNTQNNGERTRVSSSNSNEHEHSAQPALASQPLMKAQALNIDASIKVLPLTKRTLGCLWRGGVRTVGQLAGATDEELLRLKNFGLGALREVHDTLGNVTLSDSEYTNQHNYELVETHFWGRNFPSEVKHFPITILGLSVRTRRRLWTAHVKTLGDLLKLSKEDLQGIRHLGEKGISEISEGLKRLDTLTLQQLAGDLADLERIPLELLPVKRHTRNKLLEAGVHSLGTLLEIVGAPLKELPGINNQDLTEILVFLGTLDMDVLQEIALEMRHYPFTSDDLPSASVKDDDVQPIEKSVTELIDEFLSNQCC